MSEMINVKAERIRNFYNALKLCGFSSRDSFAILIAVIRAGDL